MWPDLPHESPERSAQELVIGQLDYFQNKQDQGGKEGNYGKGHQISEMV